MVVIHKRLGITNINTKPEFGQNRGGMNKNFKSHENETFTKSFSNHKTKAKISFFIGL